MVQATQAEETAEPVAAFDVPAEHATHAIDVVDPAEGLYLPATHEVQELCALDDWYVPAEHEVHADAPVAEYLCKDEKRGMVFRGGESLQARS